METSGFIILRHVNSELTNNYWMHCYDCIREYYPENEIVIIDDNSNYDFITEKELYKTTIINSEYPGRGELLPYFYYLHNKFFDTAIIIHDSVFINSYIDIKTEKYTFLWDFKHKWDVVENETKIIKLFNDDELLNFYNNKELWRGCFGCMNIITHDYLVYVNSKYDISILLDYILNRDDRMALERVLACLLQINYKSNSLFGSIHLYCRWGITYNNINKHNIKKLPVIKVWTGR